MNDLNKIIVTGIIDVITIFSQKGRFEKMNNRNVMDYPFVTRGDHPYSQGKYRLTNAT